MLQPFHITEYFIKEYVKSGDTVIDATVGNGNDTLKLCHAVGKSGFVYGFDIQQIALNNTQKRLNEAGFNNTQLILDSHSEIEKYVQTSVKCVIFNLGYLPGGDHNIQTKAQTTIKAIQTSLKLLCEEGFIGITIYYGKNSGTEEKEAVMDFLKTICNKNFTVTIHDFYNRPNNPPITAIITKN